MARLCYSQNRPEQQELLQMFKDNKKKRRRGWQAQAPLPIADEVDQSLSLSSQQSPDGNSQPVIDGRSSTIAKAAASPTIPSAATVAQSATAQTGRRSRQPKTARTTTPRNKGRPEILILPCCDGMYRCLDPNCTGCVKGYTWAQVKITSAFGQHCRAKAKKLGETTNDGISARAKALKLEYPKDSQTDGRRLYGACAPSCPGYHTGGRCQNTECAGCVRAIPALAAGWTQQSAPPLQPQPGLGMPLKPECSTETEFTDLDPPLAFEAEGTAVGGDSSVSAGLCKICSGNAGASVPEVPTAIPLNARELETVKGAAETQLLELPTSTDADMDHLWSTKHVEDGIVTPTIARTESQESGVSISDLPFATLEGDLNRPSAHETVAAGEGIDDIGQLAQMILQGSNALLALLPGSDDLDSSLDFADGTDC